MLKRRKIFFAFFYEAAIANKRKTGYITVYYYWYLSAECYADISSGDLYYYIEGNSLKGVDLLLLGRGHVYFPIHYRCGCWTADGWFEVKNFRGNLQTIDGQKWLYFNFDADYKCTMVCPEAGPYSPADCGAQLSSTDMVFGVPYEDGYILDVGPNSMLKFALHIIRDK
jgi:hypothetical protein